MIGLGSSCGACKFLRRKCTTECIFAPYFSYDKAVTHFAAVHKVFGASNVSKLLLNLPVQNRNDAAITISYEALARMHDPVYGCFAHIFALQQQVANLQEEIDILENQMANNSVGNAGSANFHTSKESSCIGVEFSLQQNSSNANNHYQTQLDPLLYQIEPKQDFNGEMDIQQPPSFGWEGQDILGNDSNANAMEELFENIGTESFGCSSWFENSMIAENI